MSKQETRTRELTESDVQTLDRTIAAHEQLGGLLYTTRRIFTEIGKLEKLYHDIKSGIGVAEQQRDQLNGQLESVKAELAEAQKQTVEKRRGLAELAAEVKEKETMLSHYSQAIDRITGKAA
jgi:chromosome segregation ATPase